MTVRDFLEYIKETGADGNDEIEFWVKGTVTHSQELETHDAGIYDFDVEIDQSAEVDSADYDGIVLSITLGL